MTQEIVRLQLNQVTDLECHSENPTAMFYAALKFAIVDKPSRPVLTLNPQSVYHGRDVRLTCDVTDLGNPEANSYTFYHGSDAFRNLYSSMKECTRVRL